MWRAVAVGVGVGRVLLGEKGALLAAFDASRAGGELFVALREREEGVSKGDRMSAHGWSRARQQL